MDRNVPRGAGCRIYSLDSKRPAGQPLPAFALMQRVARAGRIDWMTDDPDKSRNEPAGGAPNYRFRR